MNYPSDTHDNRVIVLFFVLIHQRSLAVIELLSTGSSEQKLQ